MSRVALAFAAAATFACGSRPGSTDGGSPLDASAIVDSGASTNDAGNITDAGAGLDGATSDSGFFNDGGADAGSTGGPAIVFQCAGLAGGICSMNGDGSGRLTLSSAGRAPSENTAGIVLFHDDSYSVQRLDTNGTTTPLGAGAFPKWTPAGGVVFQCDGLNGGICTMNFDGSGRQTLLSAGRAPDMNAAGEIVFHDDSYQVQKRLASGATQALGPGAMARWTSTGDIVFQCSGLGGGICTMHADGTAVTTLLATGHAPNIDAAGTIVFHDDSYTVQLLVGGAAQPLGAGAFPSFVP